MLKIKFEFVAHQTGYIVVSEEDSMIGEDWLRFRAGPLRSCMFVFLILAWVGGEGMAGQHAGQGQTIKKQYKNEEYGYAVQYPRTWFPSGIAYGNAFEIRNYDPKNSRAGTERDQASLLILDMPVGSPEETNRFLDSLLAKESHAEREVKALMIDAHRAVRVKQRLKAQEPGPGVARRLSVPPSVLAPSSVFDISTYIANGPQILHLWGKVSAETAWEVIDEIIRIQESVTFSEGKGEIYDE
jgi:hypothetical protein